MFNPVQPIFDERTSLFLALRASLADISFCAPAVFPALFRGWHFTVQLFCCVRPLLPLSRETTKEGLSYGRREEISARAWGLVARTFHKAVLNIEKWTILPNVVCCPTLVGRCIRSPRSWVCHSDPFQGFPDIHLVVLACTLRYLTSLLACGSWRKTMMP